MKSNKTSTQEWYKLQEWYKELKNEETTFTYLY